MSEVFDEGENGDLLLKEVVRDDSNNTRNKIANLIDEIQWNNPYYQPVRIVPRPFSSKSEDTTAEQRELLSLLIQDRKRGRKRGRTDERSYLSFLIFLHYEIQNRLSL